MLSSASDQVSVQSRQWAVQAIQDVLRLFVAGLTAVYHMFNTNDEIDGEHRPHDTSLCRIGLGWVGKHGGHQFLWLLDFSHKTINASKLTDTPNAFREVSKISCQLQMQIMDCHAHEMCFLRDMFAEHWLYVRAIAAFVGPV